MQEKLKMKMKLIIFILLVLPVFGGALSWNNLNCPAPRAPDNGLSFIFRNGELVHFRCHPGYQMKGKAVAYCVNNVWTESAPECVPIKKWSRNQNYTFENDSDNNHNRDVAQQQDKWKAEKHRQLFNWGDQSSKDNVYGDGPRRLPLINGIWPPQDHAEQVLALGPQSTPGPRVLVKEEIDIAELRHKQLEELKKQRYKSGEATRKHKQRRRKNKRKNSVLIDASVPRETILSLGATEDGQAFSVAFAKPNNDTDKVQIKPHKHRHHRGERRRKHHHQKKKKHLAAGPGYSNFVTSRKSRVNTSGQSPYHTIYQFNTHVKNDVAELRRRPVEQVRPKKNGSEDIPFADYDTSCLESIYRREVPMIAPQVANAFVYRYETRKNDVYPFNSYMEVKYKCLAGFVFTTNAQTLFCKGGKWIGEIPSCIHDTRIPTF
ncbi:sushi domain-containing protein [Trichonephila clavipes]|uniref:Sushi domain-containing protein n=1 Tax=Trichonephila clavipes TaxID=2585209 RepID=A0A8X6W445_TRICX|nr:sushi domain-containing protein [Trichonephila clavipes]